MFAPNAAQSINRRNVVVVSVTAPDRRSCSCRYWLRFSECPCIPIVTRRKLGLAFSLRRFHQSHYSSTFVVSRKKRGLAKENRVGSTHFGHQSRNHRKLWGEGWRLFFFFFSQGRLLFARDLLLLLPRRTFVCKGPMPSQVLPNTSSCDRSVVLLHGLGFGRTTMTIPRSPLLPVPWYNHRITIQKPKKCTAMRFLKWLPRRPTPTTLASTWPRRLSTRKIFSLRTSKWLTSKIDSFEESVENTKVELRLKGLNSQSHLRSDTWWPLATKYFQFGLLSYTRVKGC